MVKKIYLPVILALICFAFASCDANASTKNPSSSDGGDSYILTKVTPDSTYSSDIVPANTLFNQLTIENNDPQPLLYENCDCSNSQPLRNQQDNSPTSTPAQSDSQSSLIKGLETAKSFGNGFNAGLSPSLTKIGTNILFYFVLFTFFLFLSRFYLRLHTGISPPFTPQV